MDSHPLQSGTTLAGRYRIEDLVGERGGSRTWRAVDVILNRSVGVQALPSEDPRALAFLEAARQSTAVPDPRFLRVLDVVAQEAGFAYVVREWTRAVQLAVLLREGPLGNRRAAIIVAEVADAIARAHEVGVYHQELGPGTILVKDNDAVRVTGLGTEHVLCLAGHVAGQGLRDGGDATGSTGQGSTYAAVLAEQADVSALGRTLYACLVARWPGGRDFGLPPAPTEHARLLRPRQVRAGVSRDVDAVCDQILGRPPRHGAAPLRSARDIAASTRLAGEDESLLDDSAPSLIGGASATVASSPAGREANDAPEVPGPPPTEGPGASQATTPPTGSSRATSSRRPVVVARALVAAAVALLIAVAAVLAYFVGRHSTTGSASSSPESTGPTSPAAAESHPLHPRGIVDFDPLGDLTENPAEAPNAIDGNPATGWTTSQYQTDPHLGNLKPGVGLLVDLGAAKDITEVEVDFGASPTNYELWAAPPRVSQFPTALTELRRVAVRRHAPATSRTAFPATSVKTRYLLVWLTRLPEESPGLYRGVIDEIAVQGVG